MENMLIISLQVQKKNLEKSNSYVMNSYEKSDGNNEMDCQSDTESYEYTRIRCRKG